MSDQDTTEPENLSDTEYMPPLPQATALGIQHVLAMFAGNITCLLYTSDAADE